GHSNYNFMRMIKLARLGILSFSTRILATGVYLGAICAFISICFGIFYIFQNLIFSIPVPGYTSLIVSQFFIGGIIMLILGIIGEYIGELFHEVKGRPNYIIEEIKNY
ncbi:MAG: glycosyltransferase, partial [Bacteroidota bacterium]